ncbi:sigma-54-dependent Fis family transcriptional regulator [Zhongshania sp. BJYM1]|uniref:sigma-54-dependent Fis family transcriptional regulator n=1 Tax=Zhongshania aquatica TaxID=2965069 RepID=UPI0022B49766|nr:sigma-54-dependent Fis family transcriptional regulator [Marortus sp. BJYM1]
MTHIRFLPKDGRILLGENRMLLIHASGFGVLRRELIETIGSANARGLLTRMGYHNGANDGQLVHKLQIAGHDDVDFVRMGPQLHMLEGTGVVKEVHTDMDVESGHFRGEYLWEGSSEAESHIKTYGIGSDPVCWMQIGYASGFVSSYMGRPILFREVECIGQGADCCRIIGKPAEEWGEDEPDLQYFHARQVEDGLSFEVSKTKRQSLPHTSDVHSPLGIEGVVGASAGFNAACHKLRQVAKTQATVLFLGESGAGKEVFARSLHSISQRTSKPFVAVNCAAIPDNLVEAELFGVERGAFTGANSTRPGRFERAEGGTLFLDEIGILNMTAQGKLLRALQEREIERVGGGKVIKTDVRVAAATNLDLREEVRQGRFREDLFYRLNVFPITVPALRDRLEDIPVFMRYFLRKYCEMHGCFVEGFTSRAVTAMLSYKWPGNIRELENLIERGVIMASKDRVIDVHHMFTGGEFLELEELTVSPDGALIPAQKNLSSSLEGLGLACQQLAGGEAPSGAGFSLESLERQLIDGALKATDGNKSAAARMLGLSRSQLYYRLGQGER